MLLYLRDVKHSAFNFDESVMLPYEVGVFSRDQMSSLEFMVGYWKRKKEDHTDLFAGKALLAAGFIEHVVECL